MQSQKEKLLKGLVTEEEYTREAIQRSVSHLRDEGYHFIRTLGSGGFGTVLEAVNQRFESFALKIVSRECINRNEAEIWPTLRHENVLPLFDVQYIPSAETFAFVMPLIPTDLGHLLEDSVFSVDINGLDLAKSYLQDVVKGLKYLHGRKLCHLDIKPDNVLISESGRALLCDFSSLELSKAGTDSFLSPFMYRPAEAVVFKNGEKATVDGFAYDVYSLGLLALELFTNEAVLKSCESLEMESNWSDQMYPRIFHTLKKEKLENAVKKTFLFSKVDKEFINILRNFVKGCMCLNPKFRPSVDDILEHKIFGGNRLFPACRNDIWERKATPKKLNFLISLFVAQAASLSLSSDSTSSCERDAGDLAASENLNLEDPMPTHNEKITQVPKCNAEPSLTKKQIFMQWITRKKLGLHDRVNRMICALRRSKK